MALGATGAAASQTVTAGTSVARPCHRDLATSEAGRAVIRRRAPARAIVSVRLRSRGDWDVAVFGRRSRLVAGSASFRGNELAEGFVRKGQRLLVQACRFAGNASSARMSVSFLREPAGHQVGPAQVVSVSTPTRADKRRLQTLGLDLTESGDADSIEVILYGEQDVQKLQKAKFHYSVRVADLAKRVQAQRRADRRYSAAQAGGSALPSGSTSYRHLADIELVDYKVRILDSDQGTGAVTRVLLDSSDGHESWGSIGVSENIIEASWEALVDSLEYAFQPSRRPAAPPRDEPAILGKNRRRRGQKSAVADRRGCSRNAELACRGARTAIWAAGAGEIEGVSFQRTAGKAWPSRCFVLHVGSG